MGDYHKEDFSPEELVALGEAEEPKPDESNQPPEGEKPAQQAPDKPADDKDGEQPPVKPETEPKNEEAQATTEETAAAEKMGFRIETDAKGRQYIVDDEGTKIPPAKWKKLYFESHERGRQLELEKKKTDLLKQLGREKYFELYPDEAPQGWKPQPVPQKKSDTPSIGDPRILDMQISGGAYDGSTLREVMLSDPESGMAIYNNYAASVLEANGKQKESEIRTKQEQEQAVKTFFTNRLQDLFGVDEKKATPDQIAQANQIGRDVLDWQVLNSKLYLDWEDAYFLMSRETRESKIRAEAAEKAIKALQDKPHVPSIGSGGGGPIKDSGWDAMAKWSDDEMSRHLDTLSEKDQLKFYKEAPTSIRTKFKDLPW